MTNAQYWLSLCQRHRPNLTNPVNDVWCRRILEDAASDTVLSGANGRTWFFPDGSALSANAGGVMLLTGRGVGVGS